MAFLQVLMTIWHPRTTFNEAFDSRETFKNCCDDQKYYTWRAVRRQHINKLTKDIFLIIYHLVMAAIMGPGGQRFFTENAIEHLHLADQPGYHGMVYQCGIQAWWIYLLIFSPVLYPLIELLFNNPPPSKQVTKTITDSKGIPHEITQQISTGAIYYLELVNRYAQLLYVCVRVGISLYHLYETFLHVGTRPVASATSPSRLIDRRRIIYTRGGLAFGIESSIVLGSLVMLFWYDIGKVHVTHLEYAIIIMPMQIVIGIVIASIGQVWYEKEETQQTEAGLSKSDKLDVERKMVDNTNSE